MSLRDKIPAILEHINTHLDYLQFNTRLYKVFKGQVKEEVKDSLKEEIISTSAYNRAIKRIPSINVINKTVQKLSKVYVESPKRLSDNQVDRDIMHDIVKNSAIDSAMNTANEFGNLHSGSLIEPFVEDGVFKFRVLGLHQFIPYSDDPINPHRMTVCIKLLGQDTKITYEAQYDSAGRKLQTEEENVRLVNIFALYSADEFMIIDSEGSIRFDKMTSMGIASTKNPYGRIPGVYVNYDKTELVPFANQAGFDISILIPKLLTDLNYAAQYMSHSIIWTKDADLTGQEINPDAIVDLGDSGPDGSSPEIGTVDPQVDIINILKLVEFELSAYFASVGIKTSTSGVMVEGREASGFSKAMDEGDATQERKSQIEIFRHVERDLWDLLSRMQDILSPKLNDKRKFSKEFVKTFVIKYGEMKILKSDMQKLTEIKLQQDAGIMSKRQAVQFLNPDFTDKQVDAWVAENEEEADDNMEKMLSEIPKSNENRDEEESQRKETLGK